MQCIVSTRPDSGVSITYPTQEFLRFLTHGGAPEGYFGRTLDREWEIEKSVRGGRRETVAARWIDAVISGGLTDAEAYELFRDRDTDESWTGKELWQVSDISSDRWFRDAWHRSHNGGPIDIDLGLARRIQAKKIVEKRTTRLSELRGGLDLKIVAGDPVEFDCNMIERLEGLDLAVLRSSITRAESADEVRAVWPAYLN